MQSLRQFWRDWRSGELRLLFFSLVLAVAALSAVGFVAQRLQGALVRDAAQLIGGDVVVVSDHPLAAAYLQQAQATGLRHMQTAVFPSMALDVTGDRTRLVSLKAVGAHYPLIAQVALRDSLQGPEVLRSGPPQPGTVWVNASVLGALRLQVGDLLQLGNARFRIAAVLVREPDTGAGFINFAPRVMMNRADLPSTGLIQPASRVTYRLAVTGPVKAAADYAAWAQAQIRQTAARGMRVETVADSGPAQEQTLKRASDFLHLVALITALMAAVAVAQSARDFARRRLQSCAVFKALGLRQAVLLRRYIAEFLWLGGLAAALGVLLGLAAQAAMIGLLHGLIQVQVRELPAPGWMPALFAAATGMVLLLAFGLPSILQLARVPPLAVLRRSLGRLQSAPFATVFAGVAVFAALLWLQAGDLRLGAIAAGGFTALALVFALLAWLITRGLRRWIRGHAATSQGAGGLLQMAARQLSTRPWSAVMQITALSLGLLALVLLVLMRTSLIDAWRASIPTNAPDRFVINIQPAQTKDFLAALRHDGVTQEDWYPMLRGRLVAINGRAVFGRDYDDTRARDLIDREFNLSASATLPKASTLVAGDWSATAGPDAKGLSVEQGIAKTLGFKMGDTLTFDIAGRRVTAPITSVRHVDWSSMHANFFVLLPQSLLKDQPVTYLAAYRAPGDAQRMDDALVRQFPNLTVVDVGSLLEHLRKLIDQVITAVQFLFLFALAAGLAVLAASLALSRQDRAREMAVWRALGASSQLLRRMALMEMLWVGAVAGLLGAAGAAAVSAALAHWVFHFPWQPPWLLWPAAMLVAALLAMLAGWWSLRDVLRRAPGQSLRQLS
ncbi:MAG: FtsX-like permease family protein [Burkholderiaceae bacterium]|nr:FtsX-like permease family protein [Burkholderiaceae bacterium]